MTNGIWVIGIMGFLKEGVFFITDKIKSAYIMKDSLMGSLMEKAELFIMMDNTNMMEISEIQKLPAMEE